jgi:hypothetical protein
MIIHAKERNWNLNKTENINWLYLIQGTYEKLMGEEDDVLAALILQIDELRYDGSDWEDVDYEF